MTTQRKAEPRRIFCERCLRWLEHDLARCPLFKKRPGIEKWNECCCTVHSCFNAKGAGVKPNKKTAETYRDFVEGE